MIDLLFIAMCKAPGVSVQTISEIIRVESAGNPNAINVNGQPPISERPITRDDAIAKGRDLLTRRRNIDVGLMQINSVNFDPLGLTLEAAFDPCMNIKAGSTLLKAAYERAVQSHGPGQNALQAALSIYNSGNMQAGHANGYVKKFYRRDTTEEQALKSDVTVQSTINETGDFHVRN